VAQHDYIIANQSGAAFRADLNNGLAAIVSQNSGATQPSTTYAYQWWADTTTGLLKIRNAANNAWITIGTLADTNFGLLPAAGGTMTGDLTLNAQSDLRLADSDSSNWVALQAPATVASNVTWTLPATDGTADQTLATNGTGTIAWVDRARLVTGTSVSATSGTAIDFTSTPSWAKRVTVVLDQVSCNNAGSNLVIQLGTSSGVETTGYLSYGSAQYYDSSLPGEQQVSFVSATGFLAQFGLAESFRSGQIVFTNITGNRWIGAFNIAAATSIPSPPRLLYGSITGGGSKQLSGVLDRVRITWDVTATFDLGNINIIYEG